MIKVKYTTFKESQEAEFLDSIGTASMDEKPKPAANCVLSNIPVLGFLAPALCMHAFFHCALV
jgi:hypothetical protein